MGLRPVELINYSWWKPYVFDWRSYVLGSRCKLDKNNSTYGTHKLVVGSCIRTCVTSVKEMLNIYSS